MKPQPPTARKISWIIVCAIAALLIVSFYSCNTAAKSTRYLIDHEKLAAVCAAEYPAHDSVITHDSTHFDTLYDNDAIQMAPETLFVAGHPIPFYVKCPPPKTITKTVEHENTVIRVDDAKVKALTIQRDDLITVNKDLMKDRDQWKVKAKKNGKQKWITWILLFIGLVGGIYLKAKKIF